MEDTLEYAHKALTKNTVKVLITLKARGRVNFFFNFFNLNFLNYEIILVLLQKMIKIKKNEKQLKNNWSLCKRTFSVHGFYFTKLNEPIHMVL